MRNRGECASLEAPQTSKRSFMNQANYNTVDEYDVPVDPMDDLQCESCQ